MVTAASMRAWVVDQPGPMATAPLQLVERSVPTPGPGEVLVRISACGVCRTDLHLAEGDLAPKRPGVVPGHEVVGRVEALGHGATRFSIGQRIGVAWLRATCGSCRFCRRGDENLCLLPRFTGWDDDGGYAEFAVVDENYAYSLPSELGDVQAAPLLCAGIIGYRALRRAELRGGGRLGIYGFGASAHLAAQVALADGASVFVMTRSAQARTLALSLGATWAGGADEPSPTPLDAALLFAPVGTLVPTALEALDRGGTLVVAGIHVSEIPPLQYQRHLFEERTLKTVTANTRRDGEEFLSLAAGLALRVTTQAYPLDRAQDALWALADDRITGAAVLQVAETTP
jgi:propanol-preferring alcohol dehydrogenase